MQLARRRANFATAPDADPARPYDRQIGRPLETLLVSGGDLRLALASQHNAPHCNTYECAPAPRPGLLAFGSSTASEISGHAYARAAQLRGELATEATIHGMEWAFESRVGRVRAALLKHLGCADSELIFSPSGTDAQLQLLFLARALLGGSLLTIIVGSDQTGSGTTFASRGQHFSSVTARGIAVVKGASVAGFSDRLTTIDIPFQDAGGEARSMDEMDRLTMEAVQAGLASGAKVLLLAMDASKLGRRGPSLSCLDAIAAAWPRDVLIAVDACQMRLGRQRLRTYLGHGFLVLITGSKFFTGPCFSGALLAPARIAARLEHMTQLPVTQIPRGLGDYSTRFDWPRRWRGLRGAFSDVPNFGQWLRWEAALEEIRGYFEIPAAFRNAVLAEFAHRVSSMIEDAPFLELLPDREDRGGDDEELRHRTILAFIPRHRDRALDAGECTALYRALARDMSFALPSQASPQDRAIAATLCQVGQPVVTQAGFALRLCASARIVRRCWARGQGSVTDVLADELAAIARIIAKIEILIANPAMLEKLHA